MHYWTNLVRLPIPLAFPKSGGTLCLDQPSQVPPNHLATQEGLDQSSQVPPNHLATQEGLDQPPLRGIGLERQAHKLQVKTEIMIGGIVTRERRHIDKRRETYCDGENDDYWEVMLNEITTQIALRSR